MRDLQISPEAALLGNRWHFRSNPSAPSFLVFGSASGLACQTWEKSLAQPQARLANGNRVSAFFHEVAEHHSEQGPSAAPHWLTRMLIPYCASGTGLSLFCISAVTLSTWTASGNVEFRDGFKSFHLLCSCFSGTFLHITPVSPLVCRHLYVVVGWVAGMLATH